MDKTKKYRISQYSLIPRLLELSGKILEWNEEHQTWWIKDTGTYWTGNPEQEPKLFCEVDLVEENKELRRLLWLLHASNHFHILYGDDGEMQCGACGLDFKRDSIETISKLINQVKNG